jgi:hypothetical protein
MSDYQVDDEPLVCKNCGALIAEDFPGVWFDAMNDDYCGDPDTGDERTHEPRR